MKFLASKCLLLILFLSCVSEAYSQTESSKNIENITIKGQIENPLTTKIHFSNTIRCDSLTGCAKFVVNKEIVEFHSIVNRDIIVSKQHQPFTLSNIPIKRDKQLFFFFDSFGRFSQVMVEKSSVVHGVIDVGNINLKTPHLVTGKIQFPDFLKKDDLKNFYISFSHMDEKNDLYLVGFSQLNEAKAFNLQLISGKYTVFFDMEDIEGKWRRVTKVITIEKSNIDLGSILISSNLDDLVAEKASLTKVLDGFSLAEFNESETATWQQIQDLNQGITLVYYFAGYCGPCLAKDGLSKYIKLTQEFADRFALIGIHSDSYRMTKNCPTSQIEMRDYLQSKPAWKNIQDSYTDAQENMALLSFQPAHFAEKLSINAYPTMLVFKDGILQKWFVGSDSQVEKSIRELLK